MSDFEKHLDDLLDRLRSGKATSQEIAELEQRLADDADLRKQFRSRMRQEANLLSTFQTHPTEMLPFEPEPIKIAKSRFPTLAIAAAFMVTALVTCYILEKQSQRRRD